jgi:tight adherence protein B
VHRRRLAAGLPGVLDDAARALRAGASLRQAITEAAAPTGGPAAALMASLASQVEMGVPLVDALDQLARDEPSGEVRLVAAALRVAAEAGGRAATAVEAVAATLRERHAAAQEVAAHSVQARLSAVVIALLPVAFTVWCVVTDDRAAAFLLASRAGWLCLIGGLGLLGTGAWWMARIVGSAP